MMFISKEKTSVVNNSTFFGECPIYFARVVVTEPQEPDTLSKHCINDVQALVDNLNKIAVALCYVLIL